MLYRMVVTLRIIKAVLFSVLAVTVLAAAALLILA